MLYLSKHLSIIHASATTLIKISQSKAKKEKKTNKKPNKQKHLKGHAGMRRACWKKVSEADGRSRERVIKGENHQSSYIYIQCALYMYEIYYIYIQL